MTTTENTVRAVPPELDAGQLDINLVNISTYDFVDFGCSRGGSLAMGTNHLGGRRGFGVDININKVREARAAGHDAFLGDFCNLDLPSKCVDFAILSHVLEHMPRLYLAQKALLSAMRIAKDFVYIRGPYFDCETQLNKLGLKFYWADWRGHPCHLTVEDLCGTLDLLGHREYEIYGREPIIDSTHPTIHPLSSPPEQHKYDPQLHPEKPIVKFKFSAFVEFIAIIWLHPNLDPTRPRNIGREHSLIAKSGSWFPLTQESL